MHPVILPSLRLLSFLSLLSIFNGTESIGQMYCYKPVLCPTMKRIPYDIPPVTIEETSGVVDDVRAILKSFDAKLSEILKRNESDEKDASAPKEHVTKSIRGLDHYKYLPTNSTFALVIGALLICGLFPRVMDYLLLSAAAVLVFKYI